MFVTVKVIAGVVVPTSVGVKFTALAGMPIMVVTRVLLPAVQPSVATGSGVPPDASVSLVNVTVAFWKSSAAAPAGGLQLTPTSAAVFVIDNPRLLHVVPPPHPA